MSNPPDFDKMPYAAWLEFALSGMIEDHPTKIAVVSISEDGIVGTSFYRCSAADLMTLAGALQVEAIRSIVEDVLDDDGEGDEDDG